MFSISDTMMTMTTNGASSDNNNIHLLDPSLPNFSFTPFSRLPSLRDLLDPEDDFDFFIQQPDPAPEEEVEEEAPGGGAERLKNIEQQARGAVQMKQQPSKRDRHSKIVTARGLRDRRMRLSLEVAKKFFGLQDLLGYEKASKTVEWLLLQANAEINKLSSSHVMDFSNNIIIKGAAAAASKSTCNSPSSSTDHDQKKKRKKVIKAAVRRRSTSLGGGARDELRAQARERAKARTMARKIKNQSLVGRSGEGEEEEEEGEEESVVRKSSTTSNIIMMLANINPQDDHNQFLIPQQELQGDQVNGLISSFGQSWEAASL